MLELITGILLAAWAVYFVLRPILHPELPESGKEDEGGLEEGEDPEDDLSPRAVARSEEHTSELQSRLHLVCRLLLEKKKGPILIPCCRSLLPPSTSWGR